MTGLIEAASQILSNSERRLESISQNIANVNTPGYKRQISFIDALVNSDRIQIKIPNVLFTPDMAPGTFVESGNGLDLAIVGAARFLVRDGENYYLSRGGAFERDGNGALVNGLGMILQQSGGGDVVTVSAAINILADGTVLDNGAPVAMIGMFLAPAATRAPATSALNGSMTRVSPDDLVEDADSQLRQGMIEQSNVVLSDEMVTMLTNQRQAEMGGQIVRYYDQLLGRAITTFSGGG